MITTIKSLLLLGLTIIGTCNLNERKEDFRNMNNSQYPVIFADTHRSSFINTASASQGIISWEKFLNDDKEIPFNPRALLLSGDQIFAYSTDLLISFNLTGEKLWTRNIRSGSPVSVAYEKVYFRKVEAYDELAAVMFDNNEVEKKMWILESDGACFPLYIEPLENSFIALCQCVAPPEQGSSMFLFYKKEYLTEDFIWVENISGRSEIPPLHFKDYDRFIVFASNEIIIYNTAASKNGDNIILRLQNPMDKILSASGDKSGNLYLIGKNQDKILLICLDQKADEKWRWTDEIYTPLTEMKQPPVIGIDGRVHLVLEDQLITLKNGQIINRFTTDNQKIDYCTAIADGSVFISASNLFYSIDSTGKIKFNVQFEDKILTPPVVDSEGDIYLATSKKIFKIF